jgi:hypothetical protein
VGRATTDTLTNKTLTTPNLGTPSTLVLTNATGLPAAQLTGTQTIPKGTLPTGSVLQLVNATYSTETSNSTTTFADTGLTASITPLFSTSKILIIISHPSIFKSNGHPNNSMGIRLYRGATLLEHFGRSLLFAGTTLNMNGSASYSYLDSPSTTSSTTYKTQFRNEDNNGALVRVQVESSASTITLMEIAA